ncbi:hypothetical protein AB0M43_36190 [Longispora sp. NPDC051575]|uniref:hypothetical protein n=1 Tax=Longispora sp. NPDC051575 TaxID=3154943 RepID=UPI00343EBCB4
MFPDHQGQAMEIHELPDGRRFTNRAGAGEHLGKSAQTIKLRASPKGRASARVPFPLAAQDEALPPGEWFALDDLDDYAAACATVAESAPKAAKVQQVRLDGDPDELITAAQFRDLLAVSKGAWDRYVWISKDDWEAGTDGYLPRPDDVEETSRGTVRKWKLGRAQAWINARAGASTGGGRPPATA